MSKIQLATSQNYVDILNRAIIANPKCAPGLLCRNGTFYLEHGPEGHEALALLVAEDPYFGYWYGYACPFDGRFASMIIRMNSFVQGYDLLGLFYNFYTWAAWHQAYTPCKVQHSDDAFAVSENFSEAIVSLASMISRFEIDKRFPDEDSPFFSSPLELRPRKVFLTRRNQGS